jgi:hypothetical protein
VIVQGFQAGVMTSQVLQVGWRVGDMPRLADRTSQKESFSPATRLALSLGIQSLSYDEQSTTFSTSSNGMQLDASSRTHYESQREEMVQQTNWELMLTRSRPWQANHSNSNSGLTNSR